MPGTPLEQSNSNEVSKDVQPEDPENAQRVEPQAPVRELTQTDKLNKRLLVSFLNRMNSQSSNDQESDDKSDEEVDNDTSFD